MTMSPIIYGLKDAGRYLYHYAGIRTALDQILKSRTLRIGPFSRTNDPKESRTWRFDLGGENIEKYDMGQLSAWLSQELKANTRLACFSMDSAPLTGSHIEDIVRRGFCKPRMWAQYADRHAGVCLVFDWKKLIALFERRVSLPLILAKGPVQYADRLIGRALSEQEYLINPDHLEKVGKEIYVRDHISTHLARLFFEKMNDWRDEAEFRCVVFGGPTGDLYLDFEDSLAGIMFGDATTDDDIRLAMAMTKEWGIDYMSLKWHNSSPWYDLANRRFLSPPWGTREG